MHVPSVVAPGGRARMLDAEWQTVASTGAEREGGQTTWRAKLTYEVPAGVRVVRTVCRLKGGSVVEPSDDQVRRLDASAATLAVSHEPLPLSQ